MKKRLVLCVAYLIFSFVVAIIAIPVLLLSPFAFLFFGKNIISGDDAVLMKDWLHKPLERVQDWAGYGY